MAIDVQKIQAEKQRDIRIMRDKAAVSITRLALPTIVLLFAGLVFSIIYIEDAAMIAIIASATSSTSMALIAILNGITGVQQKEDPVTSLMKEQSKIMRELIEYVKKDKSKSQSIRLGDNQVDLTEGGTNIHMSGDDVVWGKGKLDKDDK
tara:strand:- start:1657 stop:2106 length:450 start_codon:yes stop_codon:yes gene_type:complete